MGIEIKVVNQKEEARQFSRFGNALYADNPYYVPDMENDIMNKIARNNDSEGETIPFLACCHLFSPSSSLLNSSINTISVVTTL